MSTETSYQPLDQQGIARLEAIDFDDLSDQPFPVRVQESQGFKPKHIQESHGEYTIDYPIDAGTNLILSTADGTPALVMALFEYQGIPTIHMIQRAKRKDNREQPFVIATSELSEYRRQGFGLAAEIARRLGKEYFQVVSGYRNLWAHDPDGEIPLSVLLATYDKGMRDLGFVRCGSNGEVIDTEIDEEIERVTKKILNGDKTLTWDDLEEVLGQFYFWRMDVE